MKNIILISFLFLVFFQQSSCAVQDEEARAVVNEFVQAMYRPVNFKVMAKLYEDFPFNSVARADTHEITSMEKEGAFMIADIHSFWTTSKGEKIVNDFKLKLAHTENGWKIVNSKGLSNIKGLLPDGYEYAVATGMLGDVEKLWDVEYLQLLKKAENELNGN